MVPKLLELLGSMLSVGASMLQQPLPSVDFAPAVFAKQQIRLADIDGLVREVESERFGVRM
jgi:hypothetical protein